MLGSGHCFISGATNFLTHFPLRSRTWFSGSGQSLLLDAAKCTKRRRQTRRPPWRSMVVICHCPRSFKRKEAARRRSQTLVFVCALIIRLIVPSSLIRLLLAFVVLEHIERRIMRIVYERRGTRAELPRGITRRFTFLCWHRIGSDLDSTF
jgi:hypothetical protein